MTALATKTAQVVVVGAIVGALGAAVAGSVAVFGAQYAKHVSTFLALSTAECAAMCVTSPFLRSASEPFAVTSALFYPAKYRLKCWKASDDTPTTFCKGLGQLFFSKKLFKWKDCVPGQ